MECEFEEKQYEEPLNHELSWKRRIWYTPGQVFEQRIGIDAAIFSKNPLFWALWNEERKWKGGVILEPKLWSIAEKALNADTFPKFRFNLFIQHKRPEHIASAAGREYKHWLQPYFRYDITGHQQRTLCRLEQNTSLNAIVVYACPVFWKLKELWQFIRGKLVENSNFVRPYTLESHQRYTFIRGGNVGKAFSEPEEIESVRILGEIDKMFERRIAFENNTQFITTLARQIKVVIEESEREVRDSYFSMAENVRFPEHELGISVMTIMIFNFITNISWGIGYDIREKIVTNEREARIKALIDSL